MGHNTVFITKAGLLKKRDQLCALAQIFFASTIKRSTSSVDLIFSRIWRFINWKNKKSQNYFKSKNKKFEKFKKIKKF